LNDFGLGLCAWHLQHVFASSSKMSARTPAHTLEPSQQTYTWVYEFVCVRICVPGRTELSLKHTVTCPRAPV